MLNAYGRVDKGRLIALDSGAKKNSAFGMNIRDTYDSFREIQKATGSSNNANCSVDRSKLKESVEDSVNDINSSDFNPWKRNSKSDSSEVNNSVVVSDTLLSSLLINAVLSALAAGEIQDNIFYVFSLGVCL